MPGVRNRQSAAFANALVAAAETGHLQELQTLLLDGNPDVQTVVRFWPTRPILQSSAQHVKGLCMQSGNTALRAATALGDAECICELLSHGANVDLETSRGTALLAASTQGDVDTLVLLLDKGANINRETASGALCILC